MILLLILQMFIGVVWVEYVVSVKSSSLIFVIYLLYRDDSLTS